MAGKGCPIRLAKACPLPGGRDQACSSSTTGTEGIGELLHETCRNLVLEVVGSVRSSTGEAEDRSC